MEYGWYYMPILVNKIFIHDAKVIASMNIPIGQLSEGAQEARNKHLKQYREFHTRKASRQDTNRDFLKLLLSCSNPYISSLRQLSSVIKYELIDKAALLVDILVN